MPAGILFRFPLFLTLIAVLMTAALNGCSGGSSSPDSSSGPPATAALGVALSSSSVTAAQGGSIARITANLTRTNDSNSVTLTVTGLPSGVTVSYDQQPGTGNSGVLALNPMNASIGSYSLTVTATDGTVTATAPLTFAVNSGAVAQISTPITWSSTGPLISAIADATHPIISVKDPDVFYYNNQWNVYATTADSGGNWNMVYLNFSDWSSAASAKPYYMDENPGFTGYHCAPEVFYFTPQKKWYMIFQSGPPQYSTTTDPTNPASWSTPASFFSSQPSTVSNWIDFWVICDTSNCYLFFSGDNGNFYRSQTSVANFPQGFSTPEIVLSASNEYDLFESGQVYALQGMNQYLINIEAIGPTGHRYFRSFTANSLDGAITPLANANSWATPFAGSNNVTFAAGVGNWTDDISHGGMIRVGYDETLTIDPANMQFLYQGVNPSLNSGSYVLIPWQLGLLTRTN